MAAFLPGQTRGCKLVILVRMRHRIAATLGALVLLTGCGDDAPGNNNTADGGTTGDASTLDDGGQAGDNAAFVSQSVVASAQPGEGFQAEFTPPLIRLSKRV